MLASKRHSQGIRASLAIALPWEKSRGSPRILLNSHKLVPSPAERTDQKTELGQASENAADEWEAGPGALPSLRWGPVVSGEI